MYPDHLGLSEYVDKVGEWKEETVSASKPNPLEGIEERPSTSYWLGRT
jgi:hypothetical protein